MQLTLTTPPVTNCRICNASGVTSLGDYQPYRDFTATVFECSDCGCRFVEHDDSAFESLHSSKDSHYGPLIRYADDAAATYRRSGLPGLRRFLRRRPRARFVIDTLDAAPDVSNILEVGCSRGYLTSYFIARKANVLGIDISKTAIDHATATFGNHFALVGDPIMQTRASYDAIYHMGTIGSVESPIEFTRSFLELLRPGGMLVFNSPNVASCHESGNMWVSTPPPDLVTLFNESFWKTRFATEADVTVSYQPTDGFLNVRLALQSVTGRRGQKRPSRSLLNERAGRSASGSRIKALVRRAAGVLGGSPFWPKYVPEYGLFVCMKKR